MYNTLGNYSNNKGQDNRQTKMVEVALGPKAEKNYKKLHLLNYVLDIYNAVSKGMLAKGLKCSTHFLFNL